MATGSDTSIQLNVNDRYNSISQEIKDLVFGYIRRFQPLFPKNIPYYNIPTGIKRLCTLYHVFIVL